MSVALLARGWRPALAALVESAQDELIVTVPFIKHVEADWLASRLHPDVALTVLTNVNPVSAQEESLDISALSLFASRPRSTVTTLPRLHAKVFVADENAAIITSANLTAGGLSHNYEYGAQVSDPSLVRSVRDDLAAYRRVGNTLQPDQLAQLDALARDLRVERARVELTMDRTARRAFADVLREIEQTFLEAQVGERSANAIFADAILYCLRDGALATAEMQPRVRSLLPPELCDDTRERIINGERFGKVWKHALRSAQQHLKRRGAIDYSPTERVWRLVP